MSLINQALKKAQQDRVNGPHSTTAAEHRPANYSASGAGIPARRSQFMPMKYLMAGLLLVIGLGLGMTFMITTVRKPETVAESASPETAAGKINTMIQTSEAHQIAPRASHAAPPNGIIPEQDQNDQNPPQAIDLKDDNNAAHNETLIATSLVTPDENSATPAAPVTQPIATPQPLPAPVVALTPKAAPTRHNPMTLNPPNDMIQPPAEQPVLLEFQSQPTPEIETQSSTIPEPNPTVVAYLESSRVTGVRTAGSQSKVVMNNRVYRLNSIVDTKTNLTITHIQNNEIQFVDESGLKYRKQF